MAEFDAAADPAVDQLHGRPPVADLRDLDFLGSDGVSALSELHHRLLEELGVVGLSIPLYAGQS